MHSVYTTCSPRVYAPLPAHVYTHPSPHVCTQSVRNPASTGGDQVRDGATAAKSGMEATWGRGPMGMGKDLHTSELWTKPQGLAVGPRPAGASWRGALSPSESVCGRTASRMCV